MFWITCIWSGLLLCWASYCWADLNLYLNATETKRLLGIEGDLYYVRDGNINQYALSFDMPLKDEVNDLYFTWHSKSVIPYTLSFSSTNRDALKPITVSIPVKGEVPKKKSAFCVHLECTKRITTEVQVQVELQVLLAGGSTTISFNRTMVCIMDPNLLGTPVDRAPGPPVPGDGTGSKGQNTQPPATSATDSTKVFYISIASVCGAIVLVALIVAVWYVRRNRSSERYSETSSGLLNKTPCPYPARPDTPTLSTTTSALSRQTGHLQEMNPQDVQTILHKKQLDRKRISLREIIVEGTFGRVYRATIFVDNDSGGGEQLDVYIKTVTECARPDQTAAMLHEGCTLHTFHHHNINPLIATCLENPSQPYLIYPHLTEGNLKKFLQQCQISEYSKQQSLSTQQLVYLATQVARGLHFLHRQHFVHKDISARNCVVDNQLIVRICDRALSPDLFPNDYHCLGDNENRPIKWLAIEALLEKRFSFTSDVWSFGVLLWEIMTLGAQPYTDVDPFEMGSYLHAGYRVRQPLSCPDELFSIMACCWSLNPVERPQATQLVVCLQDFYSNLSQYI